MQLSNPGLFKQARGGDASGKVLGLRLIRHAEGPLAVGQELASMQQIVGAVCGEPLHSYLPILDRGQTHFE